MAWCCLSPRNAQVHSYGIPKLFRQVAHATRAWGVDAAARREFLYLVKGALRAPTSAYSFVENSFAARVVAHVAQNPELRAPSNLGCPEQGQKGPKWNQMGNMKPWGP